MVSFFCPQGRQCRVGGKGGRVVRVGAARAGGGNARGKRCSNDGQTIQGLQGIRDFRESVSISCTVRISRNRFFDAHDAGCAVKTIVFPKNVECEN